MLFCDKEVFSTPKSSTSPGSEAAAAWFELHNQQLILRQLCLQLTSLISRAFAATSTFLYTAPCYAHEASVVVVTNQRTSPCHVYFVGLLGTLEQWQIYLQNFLCSHYVILQLGKRQAEPQMATSCYNNKSAEPFSYLSPPSTPDLSLQGRLLYITVTLGLDLSVIWDAAFPLWNDLILFGAMNMI